MGEFKMRLAPKILILLVVVIFGLMAAYGFIYSLTKFSPKALAVQGFICFLFVVFIKFNSNLWL
jgi:hypothetical protein